MADVFTSAGEAWVVDCIDRTADGSADQYVMWGTSATTAAKGDTALGAEATESRVACGSGTGRTQSAADTFQWVASITCNATGKTIAEVGLFDASSSGNLIIHADFGGVGIPVVQDDVVEFTITLQFA